MRPATVGLAWLAMVACVSVVYRGFTQALTIDEAYVYHQYLNQPASALWEMYGANYHLLPTWLAWFFVHRWGKMEAVIRIPAMLGGLLYLAGSWKLARRLAGDSWKLPVALVLLTAHPIIADYYSAARGYGPALACFGWAYLALLDHRLGRAGVWMGLSVLCNFTFAVPSVCALAVYAVIEKKLLPLWRAGLAFALIAGPGIVFVWMRSQPGDFYYGADSFGLSMTTLIAPSIAYRFTETPEWALAVQYTAMPIAMMALAIAAWKRDLAAGALFASLGALMAAHHLAQVPYPWTRTGLYLMWLFLVALLAAWNNTWSNGGSNRWINRWTSRGVGIAVTALALWFVAQFDTRYYFEFREDAGMHRLMEAVPKDVQACIGGSWRFGPVVNYYRLRYRLEEIEEMHFRETPAAGCRYYVLERAHRRYVDALNLHIVREDAVSGSLLAEVNQP